MYAGEDNVNDKPRLESDVDFPGEVPEELASAAFQESGLPLMPVTVKFLKLCRRS
jgi:hypothetical protein